MIRLRSACIGLVCASLAANVLATSVLFVGNSFTYGQGSPVRYYRADAVTDLDRTRMGGVPALFKVFTLAAGLDYDVSMDAVGNVGLQWHIDHKADALGGQPWDVVVLQGFSVLDPSKAGDSAVLVRNVGTLAELFQSRNAAVRLFLLATWPRADLVYRTRGKWFDTSVETMARDVRSGYDQAAAGRPAIQGVIPVGEAWVRAIRSGLADANPYDGVDADKVNLWAVDNHHASTYGYYLDALVVFGRVTSRDPRSLGDGECAAMELGLPPRQIHALQQVAYEQLAADATLTLSPFDPVRPGPCSGTH